MIANCFVYMSENQKGVLTQIKIKNEEAKERKEDQVII